MENPRRTVGIDALALAVPSASLDLADLAVARNVPPAKYTSGLGTVRMAIAAAHEDPVVLATEAARRVFERSGRRVEDIGMCVVGTETAVDHAKPIATYVHGQLELPQACRVYETKHACYGGTAGLLAAAEWIASGAARGRSALVVCTDIARYALGSAGEPTQGAGAVAMVVSSDPRLVAIDVGKSGTYARDVHDFWRPLHRKEALVDGPFSVQCYLDALVGAYDDWLAAGGDPEQLTRSCYHVPYPKMARKAHRARKQRDGMSEEAADASFAEEVLPSLVLPSQVGNIYTGSLYLALASLLHAEAPQLVGRSIGLFSYGSGSGAEFFTARVSPEAPAMMAALRVDSPLVDRRRIDVAEYERIRRADEEVDRRPVVAEAQDVSRVRLCGGRPAYLGIDHAERRVYGTEAEPAAQNFPQQSLPKTGLVK